MLTIIPKDVVDADTNRFIKNPLWFSFQIALILSVGSLIVYYNQKQMRAKAELDERCFRILAEYAGRVVMEWDYDKKIVYHHNFEKAVGRKPLINSYKTANETIKAKTIHPDDYDIFKKAFSDMTGSQNVENVCYRIRDVDEAYCVVLVKYHNEV